MHANGTCRATLGSTRPHPLGFRELRAHRLVSRAQLTVVVTKPASTTSVEPSTSAPAPRLIKIRRRNPSDDAAIASLCGKAFAEGAYNGLAKWCAPETVQELEVTYANALTEDVREKISEASMKKAQAQQEHRELRLRRQTKLLRAQLASLQGERAVFPGPLTPQEERNVAKWLRNRKFMCLVATDPVTGKVAGCVFLSMMQCEAWLPPPFPSTAAYRLYISNLCVSPRFRRCGVAKSLIQACETLGRRWGQDSIWLNVSSTNMAAVQLYQQVGYKVVSRAMRLLFMPPKLLMKKSLSQATITASSRQDIASTAGSAATTATPSWSPELQPVSSRSSSNGTYIWRADV